MRIQFDEVANAGCFPHTQYGGGDVAIHLTPHVSVHCKESEFFALRRVINRTLSGEDDEAPLQTAIRSLWTVAEAAKVLGVAKARVYALARRKKMQTIRISKHQVRIDPREVHRAMQASYEGTLRL